MTQTTILDIPIEIRDIIMNYVREFRKQELILLKRHKKKFNYTLEIMPDIVKVLWTASVKMPFSNPIRTEINEYNNNNKREFRFFKEMRTKKRYLNIAGYITQSSHYHNNLIDYQ